MLHLGKNYEKMLKKMIHDLQTKYMLPSLQRQVTQVKCILIILPISIFLALQNGYIRTTMQFIECPAVQLFLNKIISKGLKHNDAGCFHIKKIYFS